MSVVTQINRALYQARFSRTTLVNSDAEHADRRINGLAVFTHRDDNLGCSYRRACINRHLQRPRGEVGHQVQRLDAALRYRLQPDRLPDARARRVGGTAGMQRLLAAKLPACVGRVPDGDDDLLLIHPSSVPGDVEGKRVIAATMATQAPAVEKTVVSQSTAPKCSKIRRSRHSSGMANSGDTRAVGQA